MKSSLALSLLVASAAAFPAIFSRQDAVGDAVAQFKALSDDQQADFLDQISVNANSKAKSKAASAAGAKSANSTSDDVVANVNAFADDDGEANVAIDDSNDIEVNADVQALDDGIVNLNIQGK